MQEIVQDSLFQIDSNITYSQQIQGQLVQIPPYLQIIEINQNEGSPKDKKKKQSQQQQLWESFQSFQQYKQKLQQQCSSEFEQISEKQMKKQVKETKDIFFHVRNLIEQTANLNVQIELKKQSLELLKNHFLRIHNTAKTIFDHRQTWDQQIIQSLLNLIENDQKVIQEDLKLLNKIEQAHLKSLKTEKTKETYKEYERVFESFDNQSKNFKERFRDIKKAKNKLFSSTQRFEKNVDKKQKQVSSLRGTERVLIRLSQLSIQKFNFNKYTLTFEYDQIMDTIDEIKSQFRKMLE